MKLCLNKTLKDELIDIKISDLLNQSFSTINNRQYNAQSIYIEKNCEINFDHLSNTQVYSTTFNETEQKYSKFL